VNAANVDHVLAAIRQRMDRSGHATATLHQLCSDTALSEATVKRAIRIIKDSDTLAVETQRGAGARYLFGPKQPKVRISRDQSPDQSGSESGSARNAFNQSGRTPSGSSPVQIGAESGSESGSAPALSPRWFVCCIWFDEKGEMWTHGRDGTPTYMPCDSKEEAMELAERHSRMFHKDKQQNYGVLPAVDVCEQGPGENASKVLHYRYGTLRGQA